MKDTYPALDTLRALAAIAVLTTHTAFWSGLYTRGLIGAAFARLDIGVAIFFVLSGFLLTMPFLTALSQGNKIPSISRYLWKRSLRILPLYWIVVPIAFLVLEDNRESTLWYWLSNLTFTQIYFFDQLPHGLTQMWSLSTEVAFYILLPIGVGAFALITKKRGWSPRLFITILGLLVLTNFLWHLTLSSNFARSGFWLPSFLTWFVAGAFLAYLKVQVNQDILTFPRIHKLASLPGTSWTLALSLFAIAATPLAGPIFLLQPTGPQAAIKNLLYGVIAFLIIAPSVLAFHERSRYNRFLEIKPLRRLGLISYGIFVTHVLVLHASSHLFNVKLFTGYFLVLWAATLVGSIMVSEISYRLIEEPALRFKNWSPRKTRTTTRPSEPKVSH